MTDQGGGQQPSATQTGASAPPRRRRAVVRAVIGLLLIAGMVLGYAAMERQKSRRQAEAIRRVVAAGGRVYFDYQWKEGTFLSDGRPQQAAWLRRLAGPDYFDRAVALDLREADPLNDLAPLFPLMPYLTDVNASGTSLGDHELRSICRLSGLLRLDLSGTAVTDGGLAPLVNLTRLGSLSLAKTDVSGRSLETIGQLKQLRQLDLSGTSIGEAQLDQLRNKLPRCEITGR